MKVGGAGRAQGSQSTSKSSKARSGSGERFRIEQEEAASEARNAGGAAAAAPVDALLALQEVESAAGGVDNDAPGGRKRAVARAEEMLDILEDIRFELLSGGLPKAKLDQLLRVVNNRRDMLSDRKADPRLAHVLDEIELRAQVELAKFEQASARQGHV